jgi:diadenosine tetraphosphate (Ap4A) HIT family hydrolase
MPFELNSRIKGDTFFVGDLKLCRVLLMRDARFPWLSLVPRRADLTEIHDLSARERAILMEEASGAGEELKKLTAAKKINIGALGNIVPQLHVHVVARFEDDAAWPGPVWGCAGEPEAYAAEKLRSLLAGLRRGLDLSGEELLP